MSTEKVFVGMDVHKDNTQIHVLDSKGGDVYQITIKTESEYIRRAFTKFKRKWDIACCVYEAGISGFTLARQLQGMGVPCEIAATSLIPRTKADLVKTDRRDARKLADYLRTGLLTFIHQPTEEEESCRTLLRTREQVVKQIQQLKQYILKLLRRLGVVYRDGNNWTQKHLAWLSGLEPANPVDRISLQIHLSTLRFMIEQEHQLDTHISDVAHKERYSFQVGILGCFRGIQELNAMKLITEINDVRRFPTAGSLMNYTGLTPGEYSSGGSRSPKSITKAGNHYLRRTLVMIARHYDNTPSVSKALAKRQEGQPDWARQLSWRVQQRLHKRMVYLRYRKEKHKAVVAVARELAGFIWAALHGPEKVYEGMIDCKDGSIEAFSQA